MSQETPDPVKSFLKGAAIAAPISLFVGQILSQIAFFFFKFFIDTLSLPLELLMRRGTGIRYFSPLLLLLQCFIGIPATLVGIFMTLRMSSNAQQAGTLLVATVWAGAVTIASARRLLAGYRQMSGSNGKIIYTQHEGRLRFAIFRIRGYFTENLINEAIFCAAFGVVFAVAGQAMALPAIGYIALAFFAVQVRRALRLYQIWNQVLDVVDAQYLGEFQRFLVSTFLPERLEHPLSNPLAEYLRGHVPSQQASSPFAPSAMAPAAAATTTVTNAWGIAGDRSPAELIAHPAFAASESPQAGWGQGVDPSPSAAARPSGNVASGPPAALDMRRIMGWVCVSLGVLILVLILTGAMR